MTFQEWVLHAQPPAALRFQQAQAFTVRSLVAHYVCRSKCVNAEVMFVDVAFHPCLLSLGIIRLS